MMSELERAPEPKPPVPTSNKAVVLADLDFATDRLSTQVRQLSLGVLAVSWALLVKDEGTPSLTLGTPVLLGFAAMAILTMVVDFLQYLAAYFASRRALEDLKDGGTGKYKNSWRSFRARKWCFALKLGLCLVTVGAFLVTLAVVVVSGATAPRAVKAAPPAVKAVPPAVETAPVT